MCFKTVLLPTSWDVIVYRCLFCMWQTRNAVCVWNWNIFSSVVKNIKKQVISHMFLEMWFVVCVGSYLLTGGYECVLVKWMTETTLKKPDTLPRLSAPIVNISCSLDNQHYALSYIDNGNFPRLFLLTLA